MSAPSAASTASSATSLALSTLPPGAGGVSSRVPRDPGGVSSRASRPTRPTDLGGDGGGDRLECVELHDRHDYAAPAGLGGDLNLTNIATWRRCNLDSVVKAVGSTCIFDFDLWAQSGKRLGYDFCVGTTAASQPRQVAGDEVRNAAFADGVYVFDDDFRSWPAGNASAFRANRRASGRWQSVFGGAVDAGCGGGVQVVSPVCTWYQYGRPSAAVALCQSPVFGGAAPYGAGSAAAGLTKPGWRALCCRSNWYSTSGLSTRCCAFPTVAPRSRS